MDKRYELGNVPNRQTRENHGPTSKGPDRPRAQVLSISKLAIGLSTDSQIPNGRGAVENRECWDEDAGMYYSVKLFIPTTLEPLVPSFYTRYGGGRTYGGGTSREALRRAARKLRVVRNGNHG